MEPLWWTPADKGQSVFCLNENLMYFLLCYQPPLARQTFQVWPWGWGQEGGGGGVGYQYNRFSIP